MRLSQKVLLVSHPCSRSVSHTNNRAQQMHLLWLFNHSTPVDPPRLFFSRRCSSLSHQTNISVSLQKSCTGYYEHATQKTLTFSTVDTLVAPISLYRRFLVSRSFLPPGVVCNEPIWHGFYSPVFYSATVSHQNCRSGTDTYFLCWFIQTNILQVIYDLCRKPQQNTVSRAAKL